MKKIFYSIFLLLSMGCVQKYIPPVRPSDTHFLVVEGTLNSGPGPAVLTLSRTTNLDTMTTRYEQGAQVIVQGDDGSSYLLQEGNPGQYGANNLNLSGAAKYRLKIQASNGGNYLSDYVSVIPNPPIDTISYHGVSAGLQISVNTHNPRNNTRYYQWQYKETWEFHSAFLTNLKYIRTLTPQGYTYSLSPPIDPTFPPNPVDSTIYKCWQTDTSTEILIGSSANLSEDVIDLPIATIPSGSWKLSVLYAIDIKQFGWSQAGYQFLDAMKKNTENTGSVFNPLPSQLVGNIHSVSNAAEPVIGFFNISPLQERIFFIGINDVKGWDYERICTEFELPNNPDSLNKYGSLYLPIDPAQTKPIPFSIAREIITYHAAFPTCVDCTLSGTNIKPAFWP